MGDYCSGAYRLHTAVLSLMLNEGIEVQVVGAFSGVAGLELGLEQAGMSTVGLAEIDPFASAVLAERLPGVENHGDVTAMRELPPCDLVAAGFPCQDLSQAGRLTGIHGERSGLVKHIFAAIRNSPQKPDFLLFENVPFLLSLHGGAGIRWLTSQIEDLKYRWAYRVVDTQAFGLPQRRRRLFVLASRTVDPATILFDLNREDPPLPEAEDTLAGFYWTEGNTGVGWAIDAIPPLKSTALVVSAPAVWRPAYGDFIVPTIEDAEALQGLPRGWTELVERRAGGKAARWRLVGNAVSVPAARWIGKRIMRAPEPTPYPSLELSDAQRWPHAAYGGPGLTRRAALVGAFPGNAPRGSLVDFLSPDAPCLSSRASAGFLSRLEKSRLRVPHRFRDDLRAYVQGRSTDDRSSHQRSNEEHKRAKQFA